jgi:hypothetical protein
MNDDESLAIERERLEIERRRLSLDEQKSRTESRQQWFTRIGVVVPLLVALLVFWGNVQSDNRKADADFQIKAAEIVMNTQTPTEAYGRARALKALFPDRLPPNFAQGFDPEKFSDRSSFENGQRVASKKELIGLIAAQPEQRDLIIKLWKELFPGDTWIDEIK